MKIEDYISPEWLRPNEFSVQYQNAVPFPHIKFTNFIKEDLLEQVLAEFPNLEKIGVEAIRFSNSREVKFASKGMAPLSKSTFELVSFLNSDIFLQYLQELSGINEPLLSDPYLAGGGYHEIKKGGFLKVHADFNKHPKLNLDRRLNLIIYLNKNWKPQWGGGLQLFDDEMTGPKVSIIPDFNTAILFSTRSDTFHGHPDALDCPPDRSRKSLALYYFSTGRPPSEIGGAHSTIFKERQEDNFEADLRLSRFVSNVVPPFIIKFVKRFRK
jgi:hypothetical protein